MTSAHPVRGDRRQLVVASRCADCDTRYVNAIATETAFVALDDEEGVNDFAQRNANDRQEFFNQAMARALKPIDSHANFVMMNTFHPAQDVIQHFRKNNILIALMDTYIRVSLGRPEEMLALANMGPVAMSQESNDASLRGGTIGTCAR
jgi:histidinol-phosphate/aromatic aminotransferase/cobyric acid decarboxylase-like protein